jgi:hypothetical protein
MIAEMIAAHSLLVKAFLAFLVMGFAVPFMAAKDTLKFKKSSFIYTMIFQALATMVAFTGLIAVFAGDLPWSLVMTIMVVIWAIMMFIEIKKYKLIKVANLQDSETFTLIKSAFTKISVIQVLLVAAMVLLMILKAKGVISL